MKRTCLDCGVDYEYNSQKSMGASSERCSSCRKKDSAKNKHLEILEVAGNGIARCRKCGYSGCVTALRFIDAVALLGKNAESHDDKMERAKTQFILCLNCEEEVRSSTIEFKVINAKVYPVEVEFYSRKVTVVRNKIESFVDYNHEFQDTEVVTSGF